MAGRRLLSNRNALRKGSYDYENKKENASHRHVFVAPIVSLFLFVAATRICGILLRHRIPTLQASRLTIYKLTIQQHR